MPMPLVSDSELTGLNESGHRVVVSASMTRRLFDRARWIAEHKPVIHWAYGDGKDCPILAANPQFSFSPAESTVANEWDLGTALIPCVGNTTGSVRLYVRQHEWAAGLLYAGLRVRRRANRTIGGTQRPYAWRDLGQFSLGTSVGWRSGTFTVPADVRDEPFEAQVFVTTTLSGSSSTSQTTVAAWSLCSEGTIYNVSKLILGQHFRRQSGPPDDVFTLRTIRDIQDGYADTPRILANHNFDRQQAASAKQVVRFVIPGPLSGADLTVHIRCRTTIGASAASLKAACDTSDYTSGSGANTPSADATDTFTSSTMAWRTIMVTPSIGVTNYLFVWIEPFAGDTAEIDAVYVTQAFSDDGAFVTGVPAYRLLPPAERNLVPGLPIVNSHSGVEGSEDLNEDETVQNDWTDRFALLNNTVWWAQTRGHTVVPGDFCRSGAGYTDAYDTTSPAFAVESKIEPTWGATELAMAALVTADGATVDYTTEVPKVTAKADSTTLAGPAQNPVTDRYEAFQNAPAESGTTSTFTVFAGYTDANGIPAAGSTDLRIAGVSAWEAVPLEAANRVHFRGYAAVGDKILMAGITSDIVCARSFLVQYVRVRANITHGSPNHIQLELSDGTTTVQFCAYGLLGADGVLSFSDSYEDDLDPSNPLSAFKGSDSAATWTLTATDSTSDTDGDLAAWEIELW